MSVKFKVGDRVSAFGLEGVVASVDDYDIYPVNCVFESNFHAFTLDGKLEPWHATPSLTLIEKAAKVEPPKKEKKTRTVTMYQAIVEKAFPKAIRKVLTAELFTDLEDAKIYLDPIRCFGLGPAVTWEEEV